jgi:DNA-binding transcriptional ArsR family regulator
VTEEELLAVVSNNLRSVWPLELLLLLRQEARHAWRVDALVLALRASPSAITEGVTVLKKLGLIDVDQQGTYQFFAGSTAQDELARELCDLYARKPRAIMRAILAAPNDQIQTFADAFRLRKDPC